jgi:hypothetical protein
VRDDYVIESPQNLTYVSTGRPRWKYAQYATSMSEPGVGNTHRKSEEKQRKGNGTKSIHR